MNAGGRAGKSCYRSDRTITNSLQCSISPPCCRTATRRDGAPVTRGITSQRSCAVVQRAMRLTARMGSGTFLVFEPPLHLVVCQFRLKVLDSPVCREGACQPPAHRLD